jgi:hypothetical protein
MPSRKPSGGTPAGTGEDAFATQAACGGNCIIPEAKLDHAASSPVSVPVLLPNFPASIPRRCSMLT